MKTVNHYRHPVALAAARRLKLEKSLYNLQGQTLYADHRISRVIVAYRYSFNAVHGNLIIRVDQDSAFMERSLVPIFDLKGFLVL